MKIVHVIEYFSPVLGYQETYLAREQQKMGHEVVVLTSDRYFPFPNYAATVEKTLGERVVGEGKRKEEGITVIRMPVSLELFTRVWINDLIPNLIALNPDVIHIHSVSSLSCARIAMSGKFKDSVVLVDDHSHLSVVADSQIKAIFYAVFRMLFGSMLSKRIDHFVAITPETKEIVRDFMGITAPVQVLELGADTNLFKPEINEGKKIRKRHGYRKSDVVFIYTGKLIPDKGIDVLIHAFLPLPSNYKLLLVGSGPEEYLAPLKEKLTQSGRNKDVIWVPTVSPKKLPSLYSASDVGVWPKQESISMLEAAACGLPVIVKKSNSMRSRVSKTNGLMYEEGNVEALSKAMRLLGKSAAKRAVMGKRGRELILSTYSWERIAKKFVLLYRKKRI